MPHKTHPALTINPTPFGAEIIDKNIIQAKVSQISTFSYLKIDIF
jgi:hypothetical protein